MVTTRNARASKRKAVPTSMVPLKRPRKCLQKSTIQYVNPHLKYIQNDVGHPITTAMASYVHSSILQLPFQLGVLKQDTLYQHYELTSWTTTYPVPLITYHSSAKMVIDPLLKLVKAKKKHVATLAHMKLSYGQKKSAFKKACKGLEGKLYPNMVIKVAEEMERDPDKWFSDLLGYDYYFTGGCLSLVDRGQSKWMLHTIGDKMNVIEMFPVQLDGNDAMVDSDQLHRIQLSEDDGPVYEISWDRVEHVSDTVSASQMTKTNVKYAFRRKFKVEVLFDDGEIDQSKGKTCWSDVPFISCCFLQRHCSNLICTSDLEKRLKIWNYDKGDLLHELQLQQADNTDDCWTCLRPFGKNQIVCLDRTSIKLFKAKVKLTLAEETPISIWLWSCEKASSLEVCFENKFLFIGSSHKLLILQVVYQDAKPAEFQQILTFTHNLKHFPTMIRYNLDSNQNFFVWISSHLAGDTVICNFSKVPPKRFATNIFPQKPLTAQEAYRLARLKGKCIYPTAILRRRLRLCHSGISIIVHHDRFHLFMQNSLGDVFHQQIISVSEDAGFGKIPAAYHSLMLKLNQENPPMAKVTDFKNLRGFKKIFTCTNLHSSTIAAPPVSPLPKRLRWMQSVEELHQYKDVLAPELLQIWGFRPDVTSGKRVKGVSTDETLNVSDRISDWLDTTNEEVTFVRNKYNPVDIPASEVVQIGSDDDGEILHSVVETKEGIKLKEQQKKAVVSDVLKCATQKPVAKPVRRKYVQGF
ncbi:uncharacterized protein LOC134227439 [Armigeres subalbatus]|uniref:uncharacterized protein LOC134227439 n=1 Tax=Armigeres subalbatus TaxID=124917 RepID=UPI002ED27A7D